MSAIPPVIADAYCLLRADLYRHLDQAEFVACGWDEWSDREVDTIRELIGDLVHLIRQLLREHRMQDSGECGTCSAPWPCRVVTTIHALVTDPGRQLATLADQVTDQEWSPRR